MKFLLIIGLLMLCPLHLRAEEPFCPPFSWTVSVAALGLANEADGLSSQYGIEGNPVIRAEGLTLTKAAIFGGIVLAEWLVIRKHGHARAFTITNYAISGAFGGVAIHNWRVQ